MTGRLPDDWDAQLSQYEQASIFHTSAWLRLLQQCYGFTPLCLSCFGPSGRAAHLLLMDVNSFWTGRRGVSLPFTDLCEPLYTHSEDFCLLFNEARRLGKSKDWNYLELRGTLPPIPEARPSAQYYGHTIDLRASESTLFDRMTSSVQRAIRKAQKCQLQFKASRSMDAIETYYALHCKTRKKHGLPPQTLSFFRALHQEIILPGKGVVCLALKAGQPIAGSIHFFFNDRAIYKFGASNPHQLDSRANQFIMWEAIRWLHLNGYHSLHLGRTSMANEGLRRFKLGFGADEQLIDYVKYDIHQDQFTTETDYTQGIHTRIFQMMPIPLSRLAGLMLYRHMA